MAFTIVVPICAYSAMCNSRLQCSGLCHTPALAVALIARLSERLQAHNRMMRSPQSARQSHRHGSRYKTAGMPRIVSFGCKTEAAARAETDIQRTARHHSSMTGTGGTARMHPVFKMSATQLQHLHSQTSTPRQRV